MFSGATNSPMATNETASLRYSRPVQDITEYARSAPRFGSSYCRRSLHTFKWEAARSRAIASIAVVATVGCTADCSCAIWQSCRSGAGLAHLLWGPLQDHGTYSLFSARCGHLGYSRPQCP
jgi:hypothetical protein